MQFNWTRQDRCNGKRMYVLRSPSLPKGSMSPLCADDRLAVCTHEGGRKWEARFWIAYDSIKVTAGTPEKAMRLLQAELEKKAGELFGGEALFFSHA